MMDALSTVWVNVEKAVTQVTFAPKLIFTISPAMIRNSAVMKPTTNFVAETAQKKLDES